MNRNNRVSVFSVLLQSGYAHPYSSRFDAEACYVFAEKPDSGQVTDHVLQS